MGAKEYIYIKNNINKLNINSKLRSAKHRDF